jgi:hypothetical protein
MPSNDAAPVGTLARAFPIWAHLAGPQVGEPRSGPLLSEIWLLRLRALLARAHGDATAYAHFGDGYRDMARTLGFDGHIAWAEAMP